MLRFRASDGARIAYEAGGLGESAPIVFLHGAFLSRTMWAPQLDAVGRCPHLLVDLRGHGHSDRQPLYGIARLAEDIRGLLCSLGMAGAIICGHSLGGMVAQRLAVSDPSAVGGLFLAETAYGLSSSRVEWLGALLTTMAIDVLPLGWQARLIAAYMGRQRAEVKQYVRAELAQYIDDPTTFRRIWRAIADFDGLAELGSLHCPTHVVVGGLNSQTHRQAHRMATLIPGASLACVEGAGHMINWDQPARFDAQLLSFRRRIVGAV